MRAQFRAGFTLGAEHLSGGNGGNVELFSKESSLRAFAATGRAEQKEYHILN